MTTITTIHDDGDDFGCKIESQSAFQFHQYTRHKNYKTENTEMQFLIVVFGNELVMFYEICGHRKFYLPIKYCDSEM